MVLKWLHWCSIKNTESLQTDNCSLGRSLIWLLVLKDETMNFIYYILFGNLFLLMWHAYVFVRTKKFVSTPPYPLKKAATFLQVVICDHFFVSDGLMATCSTSRWTWCKSSNTKLQKWLMKLSCLSQPRLKPLTFSYQLDSWTTVSKLVLCKVSILVHSQFQKATCWMS